MASERPKGESMRLIKGNRAARRLFARARFAEPDLAAENVEETSTGAGTSEPEKPSYDDLLDSLAKERSRAEAAEMQARRNKNALDKELAAKAAAKKAAREALPETEQLKASNQELLEENEKLRAEMRLNSYSKKFMTYGMKDSEAESIAAVLPQFKTEDDEDTFFTALGKYIDSAKKEAKDSGLEEFLKTRPDIKAGNGGATVSAGEQLAKEIAGKRSNVNPDLISRYIPGAR